MSVPVSKRTKNKLEAAQKALDLCTHSLKLTSNKNNFAVEYQRSITDRMDTLAISIYVNVRTANDIVVRDENDLEDRVKLQKKAAQECNNLRYLISVAKRVFHLRTRSVEHWIKMTIETRDIIKSWSESDKKRFNEKSKY